MPKKKAKEHKFKFKTKKGQDMEISYKPIEVEVSNEKAFQGHLEKVGNLLQCSGWGVPKKKEERKKVEPPKPKQPTIKGIDEV